MVASSVIVVAGTVSVVIPVVVATVRVGAGHSLNHGRGAASPSLTSLVILIMTIVTSTTESMGRT